MRFVHIRSRVVALSLVAVASLVMCSAASAATYYVDSAAGRDYNNGLSPSSAWMTIGRVNNQSLRPGDSVLFKRGGFWREQLNVTRAGSSNARITYGAYGSGNRPIICGSDLVTGWTVYSAAAKIYRAPYRWVSPPEPWFSTVDLTFFNGEVGIKRGSVGAISGHGQWHYSNGYLYIYSASSSLPQVRVAARNYCIYACDKLRAQYITVQDIEVRHANYKNILVGADNHNWIVRNVVAHRNGRREDVEDGGRPNDRPGINFRNCDNTLITRCIVYLAGSNGIQVTGGSNNVIEKCIVYDAQHHCIDMKGSPTRTCSNNIIRYNTVYQRPQTKNHQHGIVVTDDGTNRISNTKVYGNLVYGISGVGFLMFGTINANLQLFNNTSYNCHRCYALINMGTSHVVVKNNIGMSTQDGWHPVFSLERTSTANKVVDYNVWLKKGRDNAVVQREYTPYRDLGSWRAATGYDAHSILADPLFVNAPAGDFRLREGSPAINRAASMGMVLDKGGNFIPQGGLPDIGSYERPM